MAYTDVFGGTVIYPSDVSYLALALDADVTLDWPLESSAASTVVARIIDITPASAGLSITMPDATTSGVGQTALFNNIGPHVVTIKSNTGTTLLSLAAGEQWQLYLIDSSTPTGLWRNFRYGASTAQAQASSLAGSGLVAIGATLAQAYTVAEYNSNRTLATTDRAQTILWSGGLGTFTLPVAASVGNNWFVNVRNGGSGSLTLQPSGGGLINTATSVVLAPSDSAVVCCDGTNFYTIGLGQSAVFAFDYTSINLAGLSGAYILTGSELNRIAYTFTGALSGNIVIVAPATVQQYWVNNATSGASYTLDIKTAVQVTPLNVPRNQRGIYYSDGTNIVKADTTSGVATPIAVSDGGTGATNATTARANLGSSAVGDAVFTAVSAAAARAALAVSVVGDAIFTAASAAAARISLGASTVGAAVFTAVDAASARTAIGAGTGDGTVTSITAGTGLSGGTVTTSGTFNLANTAVAAAAYGSATSVGTFTVDAQGRLTAAGNIAINVAAALGYTPVNRAGDTVSGVLTYTFNDSPIICDAGSGGAASFITWQRGVATPSGYIGTGTNTPISGMGNGHLGIRGQSALFFSGSGGTADAILTAAGWVFAVPLAVASGGTGGATQPAARAGLGIGSRALGNSFVQPIGADPTSAPGDIVFEY